MSRTIRTLAAALTALLIASPVAFAKPMDDPQNPNQATSISSPKQDLRSPDTRDSAHAKTPADVTAALAQERYYSSYGDQTPLDVTAAQYAVAGHPEPSPAPAPATAPVAEPTDGIAELPFVLGVVGALIVGLGAGSALHMLSVRRRQATGLPA